MSYCVVHTSVHRNGSWRQAVRMPSTRADSSPIHLDLYLEPQKMWFSRSFEKHDHRRPVKIRNQSLIRERVESLTNRCSLMVAAGNRLLVTNFEIQKFWFGRPSNDVHSFVLQALQPLADQPALVDLWARLSVRKSVNYLDGFARWNYLNSWKIRFNLPNTSQRLILACQQILLWPHFHLSSDFCTFSAIWNVESKV